MPTTRETTLQALLAALQTVPGAIVLREDVLPERVLAGGLVILRDGDPGTPEVTLSPLAYHYEHRAEIEVIVQGKTPAARANAFDLLVQAIGAALAMDRTLGGLCDWTEAQAPQPVDLPVEGAMALKAAIIPVVLTYTTSKAFKRVFVHWAAAEFDWPGYSEADLFAVNKVLNEIDFPPLMDLHDLMIALKIGRHYKGQFRLTKAGQSLVGHPGRLFGILIPFYLFELDHPQFSHSDDRPMGNWDIFLNVLNVETEDGATGGEIRRALYGEPESGAQFDRILSNFYIQILRPLCWTGLLQETAASGSFRTEHSVFTKTPLWRATLSLDTDEMVKSATRH